MSKGIREQIVKDFTDFYDRNALAKENFQTIEVRIPKSTFAGIIFNALIDEGENPAEKGFDTWCTKAFADWDRHSKTLIGSNGKPARVKNWRVLDKPKITGNTWVVECGKTAEAPESADIEAARRYWTTALGKFLTNNQGIKESLAKLQYEHGTSREADFAREERGDSQQTFDFEQSERARITRGNRFTSRGQATKMIRKNMRSGSKGAAGAKGTIVDAAFQKAAAELDKSSNRVASQMKQVLKGGLADIFNYDYDMIKDMSLTDIKGQFRIRGSVNPQDRGQNSGNFDSGLADYIKDLFLKRGKHKEDFERLAQKYIKGIGPVRAAALWDASPSTTSTAATIGKKQIIQKMFKHQVRPDMRLKVNKDLFNKNVKGGKNRGKGSVGGKGRKAAMSVTAGSAVRRKKGKKAKGTSGTPSRTAQSPIALRNLLNEALPAEVAKNMVSPALRYRTGRFANSVRVENLVLGPRGGLHIDYTYMRDPYETFEPGNKQGSTTRDPKKLIGKSIREISVGILGRQPGTLRRT